MMCLIYRKQFEPPYRVPVPFLLLKFCLPPFLVVRTPLKRNHCLTIDRELMAGSVCDFRDVRKPACES